MRSIVAALLGTGVGFALWAATHDARFGVGAGAGVALLVVVASVVFKQMMALQPPPEC